MLLKKVDSVEELALISCKRLDDSVIAVVCHRLGPSLVSTCCSTCIVIL